MSFMWYIHIYTDLKFLYVLSDYIRAFDIFLKVRMLLYIVQQI